MGLREYPQAGLAQMPTEPGLGPPTREAFPRRLLAALYGRPGELGTLTRRWPNEPGTYFQFGFGYLAGYPFGLKDTYEALWALMALVNAAVLSYAPARAEPFEPGGGDVAASALMRYLDEAGQLDALRDLGDALRKLERKGIVDALTGGAELLAEALGEAMIGWVASYGQTLRRARTPFDFAWCLGRLAGRIVGDMIVAALVNRALVGVAEEVGAVTVRGVRAVWGPGTALARLEEGVVGEAARAEEFQRMLGRLSARKRSRSRARLVPGQLGAAEATPGPPGVGEGPVPKALQAGRQPPQLGPGKVPKALPSGEVPKALPSGDRPALPGPQLLLGDLEPGGAGTAAPAPRASVLIVPATVSTAQRALISANLRGVAALPGWAYALPDDVGGELVLRGVSVHPYGDPEVPGKPDKNGKPIPIAQQREAKVSVLSGYGQETLFTIDPAFAGIDDGIEDAVRQDGRWELATLRFTNRVYYLEPGEGLAAVPRPAGLTDGLWIVRAKDPDALAQFVMPGLVESKSSGNVTDLFYETLHRQRLPTRGQVYRDVERVPNVTLILQFPLAGDRVERWVIPPGQVGISRRTTKFVLMWPPGPDRTDAMNVLVNEGFTRRNIITLPPPFPRAQIEQFYRRFLDTPLERLLPKELLPKKAKP